LQQGLDLGADRWRVRLGRSAEPGDDLTVGTDQELREVPPDVAALAAVPGSCPPN
jgi:hypothetical protein